MGESASITKATFSRGISNPVNSKTESMIFSIFGWTTAAKGPPVLASKDSSFWSPETMKTVATIMRPMVAMARLMATT